MKKMLKIMKSPLISYKNVAIVNLKKLYDRNWILDSNMCSSRGKPEQSIPSKLLLTYTILILL